MSRKHDTSGYIKSIPIRTVCIWVFFFQDDLHHFRLLGVYNVEQLPMVEKYVHVCMYVHSCFPI